MASNTFNEPEEKVKEPEDVQERPEKKNKKKNFSVLKGIQSVLDGTILTREKVVKSLPFMFYLTFLVILYIANQYYSEKKTIEIEKVKKELKVLRSEYITTKSKLMDVNRQSEVLKRTELYGIKESLIPPHKIFAERDTTKKLKKQIR
ncbi:MAG: FtsL-like putative cell division protein [Bacteroidales bacterium]